MSRKRFLDEEDAVCFGSQDTDNQEVIPLHQVQNFGRTATVDRSNRVREPVFPKICAPPHKYLKLISWNIWNLKNALKYQSSTVFKLIAQHKPDVFFVQETKLQTKDLKDFWNLLDGYESFWNCSTMRKGYSGTAVFIRKSSFKIPSNLHTYGSGSGSKLPVDPAQKKWKKGIPPPMTDDEDDDYDDDNECNNIYEDEGPLRPHTPSTLISESGTSAPIATVNGPVLGSTYTRGTTMELPIQSGPISSVINVSYDFEDYCKTKEHAGEGRTITVEFDTFYLVACYVPNSGEERKRLNYRVEEWEPHMRNYLKHLNTIKPVVFGGDMNCCFKDQDLHSSTHIGAHQHQIQRERVAFSALLQETGFKDCFRYFYPHATGQFTFWSQTVPANRVHNKGVRLDYFLCSGDMFSENSCKIDTAAKTSQLDTSPFNSNHNDVKSGVKSGVKIKEKETNISTDCGLPCKDSAKEGSVSQPDKLQCVNICVGNDCTIICEGGGSSDCESNSGGNGISKVVTVYDSYILHEDTVGCSDHCPIVLVLRL